MQWRGRGAGRADARISALLGAPLSAVSRKTNTTRDRVLGVCTRGDTQVAFTDTPGFVLPGGEGAGGGGSRYYQRTLVAVARSQVPAASINGRVAENIGVVAQAPGSVNYYEIFLDSGGDAAGVTVSQYVPARGRLAVKLAGPA